MTRQEASPSVLATVLAGKQWGVIGAEQLRACGVSPSMAKRWRADGWLHSIHRGVFALGHDSLPVEGHLVAAIIHAGPNAVLSHATAAWWWQLLPAQPLPIEVSSTNRVRSARNVLVHHPAEIAATRHRRLRVTTVPQTLLDFASQATGDSLRVALAQADYLRLLNIDAVQAVLGQGRPGSKALREALVRHEPKYAWTRSHLERAFLALCERHRVPLPRLNVRIEGWLVDAVWQQQRVVVELDGYLNHRTRAQLDRDHRRDLALRAARYTVARYSKSQVKDQPEEVATDLKTLLG